MFRYLFMKKVGLNSLLGVFLCCAACFFSVNTFAMSITGEWRTVSDSNGESTSVIKIVKQKDGSYLGAVDYIYPQKDAQQFCENCPEPKTNKPILGMTIMHSLQADSDDANEYTGGRIMDPKSGKTYRLKVVQLSDNKLKLRGYIGIPLFGRTQYWYRYDGNKKLLLSSHG